jgi:hypothetical protein
MINYRVFISFWLGDVHITPELILTIEEGYIEDQELLEDVLLEKAKEYLEYDNIEIVGFEELTQTEQANLYQFTADDVYYNDEYMYKGDIGDKAEKFMGQSIEEALDCIKRYKKHVDTYGY